MKLKDALQAHSKDQETKTLLQQVTFYREWEKYCWNNRGVGARLSQLAPSGTPPTPSFK